MSPKDKNDDRNKPPRTGPISPTDAGLATWLHSLWARDTPPEQIQLWPLFNPKRSVRGKMIHQVHPKANSTCSPEDAVNLANELLSLAQNDCDAAEQKSFYEVAIIDHDRRSEPLVRRIGPLHPQISYLEKPGGRQGAEDDEDDDNPRSMTLRYIDRNLRHVEWKEQALNQVTGDLLMTLRELNTELRQENAQLRQSQHMMFLSMQDALDRRKERDLAGAWTELKVSMAKDGVRAGRNLLLGLFGKAAVEAVSAQPAPASNHMTGQIAHAVKKRLSERTERTLIDGFLRDCEDAGILSKLFGEWNDNGVVPGSAPGVFTARQFAILMKVRDGEAPPAALDQIVPGFGGTDEITMQQIMEAQPFIPEGIGQALIELKEMREVAHATAASKPSEAAA